MSIIIKKKNPVSHAMKVAVATIAIFVVVALVARLTRKSDQQPPDPPQALGQLLTASSSLFVPSIRLHVPTDARESDWTNGLAESTGGRAEVQVDSGRADVLTENYAVEVDFLRKWKEGLGQALYYADVTDLIPVLAIIAPDRVDEDLLKQIDALCIEKGVKLVLLVSDK